MTLNRKTLLVVGFVLLMLFIIIYLTSKTILLDSFAELERDSALKDINRAISALNGEISGINREAGDWAAWDDAYDFIESEDLDFIKRSVPDDSFKELKLDLIVFINSSGKIVYIRNFDYQNQRDLPVLTGLNQILLNPNHRLVRHEALDSAVSGIIMLPEGPMIVASRPILTSDRTGPIRGSLIMGRYLDKYEIDNLAKMTNLSLKINRYEEIISEAKEKLQLSEGSSYIYPLNQDELIGYSLIKDIDNDPALVLQIQQPRVVYNQGLMVIKYLVISMVVVGLVFIAVLFLLLNRLVLSRVANLSSKVQSIGEGEDFNQRVNLPGSDELSTLANSVNKMLDALEVSREKLRQSVENYKTIFETTGSATGIFEVGGRIILVNSEFEQFFGYTKDEVEGKLNWRDFTVDGFWEPVLESYNLLTNQPSIKKQGFESKVRLRDGSERDVLGVIALIPGSDRVVCSIIDITERTRYEKELKYLSLHDTLTGLYNRAYFEEEIVRLDTGRYNPVGIIICDVDGLKLVNDSLGHKVGDSFLLDAAKVIRSCFQEGDMIARIGGDEFAIMLPRTSQSVLEEACQRIQDGLDEYNSQNPDLPLSISVGFAIKTDLSSSLGEVFKEADNKMYREKLHRTQSARSAIVSTLMKALEARDFITEGHADRMQDMVAELGAAIGLSASSIADLRLLAQFHDIGKVGIADSILFKPGKLTPEEMDEMRRHPEIGYIIAVSSSDLAPIADWILYHHEWWNGEGYPKGLVGREIPLECRILAIVDAYDAMTSDRPYRKALPSEEVVNELILNKGVQFDPDLVDKFLEVITI